ncbi:hypothetical protein KY337_04095 [Candidatus Woesearchaeota archaeon]|nr:hypothetical protein [Candidatus Woesearchaeota archaeon]
MPKKTRFYKNKTFWAWFIVIIMVASTLGIVLNYRSEDTVKAKDYKDYKFFPTSNGYMSIINNRQFFFAHFPGDLENISVEYNLNFESEKVYFTYDPSDEINFDSSINKLGSIIFSMNLRPVKACIKEEGCPDIPVVDCEEETPKFFFKESDSTSISQENNCVVLEAESRDKMDQLVEIIYYRLLGIMN